ncbi:RNA-directed DNA polymerase, eukaryota, reverse transcriptase zinc-binding domain protein [Tanacetum coccineum]
MSRCHNWEAIVKKFSSKLSLWKERLLSVGCRISLIKSVLGNLPTYFMSLYLMPASIRSKLESLRNNFFNGSELGERKMVWVSWKTFLASKESGGLGIRSIYVLNVGLLFKWIWRFLHNHSDIWVRVIKGIYGRTGGIFDEHIHRSSQSPWSGILSMVKSIKQKGIDLMSLCNQKLGNGESAQFWDDIWCGNQALKSKFPRIYMLDNDKGCNVSKRLSMHDWSSQVHEEIRRRGSRSHTQFMNLRLLNDYLVEFSSELMVLGRLEVHKVAGPNATCWNRSIPIKVNVFLWRVMLNKLPTRVNLDRRGIDVDSLICPICHEDVETELDVPFCANISEWFSWLDSLSISNKARLFLDGVGGTLMCQIRKTIKAKITAEDHFELVSLAEDRKIPFFHFDQRFRSIGGAKYGFWSEIHVSPSQHASIT